MADTRSLQLSFKDEMSATRTSLKSMLNNLQALLSDALSHHFRGLLVKDADHPAKLAYLALTEKLNDNLALKPHQQCAANNEVNWNLKECVTAYVGELQTASSSSKKLAPFNFDQYYASLSDEKKQFLKALIVFYQAILSFTKQCRWDLKKISTSSEARAYDEAVETLSLTVKNMHVCRFTQPPSEDAFAFALTESGKTTIDAIWVPQIKEANRILQTWLAKEREVHSYIMSVGQLVNTNSLDVAEYCKALDVLELKVQQEVTAFETIKANWVKELDNLTQKVLNTAYVMNKLPFEEWQTMQQSIPGVLALTKEEERCQELESNVKSDHGSYHLARISYLILLNQDQKQAIDVWVKAYVDCIDVLIESVKLLQESCYKQTSTSDLRWTANIDPACEVFMQWAMKQKSADVHAMLRQKIEVYIGAYCNQQRDMCKKNDDLFMQRMQDGTIAIREMKKMLAKEKDIYYEQANQYYQKAMSRYKHEQQLSVMKVLSETKSQLLSKSIPSISKAFAKAKKEYADNWKPSAPQGGATSYLGTALHGVYVASRYVTVPAYYMVAAPVIAATSVVSLFSRSRPALPPATTQNTVDSTIASNSAPKSM